MGRPVYRMTVEFTARDGMAHSARVTTNRPESLEDDARETVLYDAENPACAVPIDGLPGGVSLDELGRIVPSGSKSFLTLPALSLLCNGWFIWRNWLR
jgi:hypothetical protein